MRLPDMASIVVDGTLTLMCDSGYTLSGDATATCTDPGDGSGAVFDTDLTSTTCGKL